MSRIASSPLPPVRIPGSAPFRIIGGAGPATPKLPRKSAKSCGSIFERATTATVEPPPLIAGVPIERSGVVNDGQIAGTKSMHARGGGKLRGRSRFLHKGKRFSGPHVLRRFQEIVERRDAYYYRRQRRGNLRVHRIRPVIFTRSRGVRDRVFMNRGMEGLL